MRARAAVLIAVLLQGAAARAQTPTCPDDPQQTEARLQRLADLIDTEERDLHIWSWTWGSIYAAAAITQASLAIALPDPNGRIDFVVGSITAALGSASLYLLPLRFTRPMTRLRGEWSNPDRCALLTHAEEVLTKVAPEERTGKSWLGHLGNVLFNVGVTLVLGLGFHHWQSALIGGGIGIAVGELNLLTQPTRLQAGLEQLRVPVVAVFPLIGPVSGAGVAFSF